MQTALLDRPHSILSSNAIYGATIKMFDQVFAPFDVDVNYVDICDLDARGKGHRKDQTRLHLYGNRFESLAARPPHRRIAELARAAGAALIVDSTFATPMLVRPLERGAHIVVHSATKYLAGHGDVLGGIVVTDEEHFQPLRNLSRVIGPVLGPFESYLTMRGIKTLALRFERQCQNAKKIAEWLMRHPSVEKVHYCSDPGHPDAAAIKSHFSPGLFGAILSFEIKDANKSAVLAFMDRLKLIVPGTSLGDVHTLLLYPVMASHRDISPKMRERMGIRENLVRIAAGIEAVGRHHRRSRSGLCS